MAIPTLITQRLILRPFTSADLAALTVLHAEESFWWYPLRSGMSAEQTAEFLGRQMERYVSDGFGVEAVIDKQGGHLIGWAGLAVPHFLPQILPAVEVGWRLSSEYRGRGLATEAGRAAIDFGFSAGGLRRIVSIYEPENVASGRVMEHLGFTPFQTAIGERRGETMIVTELTIETWKGQQAHG